MYVYLFFKKYEVTSKTHVIFCESERWEVRVGAEEGTYWYIVYIPRREYWMCVGLAISRFIIGSWRGKWNRNKCSPETCRLTYWILIFPQPQYTIHLRLGYYKTKAKILNVLYYISSNSTPTNIFKGGRNTYVHLSRHVY